MRIYAVGLPGQMPRQWVEASSDATAAAQCLPGEVISTDVQMGADGRPVAQALPFSATPLSPTPFSSAQEG